MSSTLERTGRAAAAAGLLALGYVATTWYRYGRPDRPLPGDPMLDHFMPDYEVAERHETRVRARLEPEVFAAFREPGYAKIAWTMVVEPRDAGESIFRTETRVSTTDAESRARFRRYWSAFAPGIRVIRWETLRLVRRAAERPAR